MKEEKSPLNTKRKVVYERPKKPAPKSPIVKRENSLIDEPLLDRGISRSNTVISDSPKWTRQHWKKLEEYYIKNDRNYTKAGISFYYRESYNKSSNADTKDLWPKEHIIWRCRCLDTNVRMHGDTLPSERKRK